jgi:DNA-binding MarR family transcriptional regulator
MAGSAPQPDDLTDAWSRMLTLFVAKRDAMFATLRDYKLTPPHAHALSVLAAGPTRMRDLADRMVCDASYITAVVDRLEEVGMAERRPSATDRRVKEIALTERGVEASIRIGSTMSSAPAEFQALSKAERRALAALLSKVVPVADGASTAFEPRARP